MPAPPPRVPAYVAPDVPPLPQPVASAGMSPFSPVVPLDPVARVEKLDPSGWVAARPTVTMDSETAAEAQDMAAWQPNPAPRSSLGPVILGLLVVAGGVTWLLQDDFFPPLVVDVPVTLREKAPLQTSPAPEKPVPAMGKPPAMAPPAVAPVTVPPVAPAEPDLVVRRAELIPPSEIQVDLEAATQVASPLFRQLSEAKTAAERAALLAEPEEYGADAEEFFAQQKLEVLSFKLSSITPLLLPGRQSAPLFQVMTRANPQGALLRLVPRAQPGAFLLDWPLFAETHEKKLARVIHAPASDPTWLHLGLRRSHGLEFAESQRSGLVIMTLQGSADGSLTCQAISPKNTPAGRYLDRETEWGQVYLARLLLQKRKLEDGTPAIFILDIEGAATSSQP